MQTKIKVLKAYHGDCILIQTYDSSSNEFNILIDGGTASTFKYSLKKELAFIRVIHLLILTHIDSDHISGLINFFRNSLFSKIEIKTFWINGANLFTVSRGELISYGQGITLENLLKEKKVESEKINSYVTDAFVPKLPSGIGVKILSPTTEILDILYFNWPIISKELKNPIGEVKTSGSVTSQLSRGTLPDLAKKSFRPSKSVKSDIFNSSSIAFLLQTFDTSILLLGDSRAEVILEALVKMGYSKTNKLYLDFIKVSHHGSINNTSCELLDLIECNNFIISTNGGNASHMHPDREVIARIVHHSERDFSKRRTIYFNYPLSEIEKKSGILFEVDEMQEGNWTFTDNTTIYN